MHIRMRNQTLMKGRKQHLQHAQDVCQMVPVVCRECEFRDLKGRINGHDCLSQLIEKVAGQDSQAVIKVLR